MMGETFHTLIITDRLWGEPISVFHWQISIKAGRCYCLNLTCVTAAVPVKIPFTIHVRRESMFIFEVLINYWH